MALDGAFLSQLKYEIESAALESRVDRIHQPSREELVIALRWRGGGAKLLLSAGANSPRIHFTEVAIENPKQPPMFCMLLRKHLGNAKLVAVRQIGLDRILHLDFESVNEMGDLVTLTLAVEIMGRHSNIILIGPDGRVIDAIKRIDDENVFRKMQGHWIIEMSEMIATANAKSIEDIKSFLSRQKETYKVPYATEPEDRLR